MSRFSFLCVLSCILAWTNLACSGLVPASRQPLDHTEGPTSQLNRRQVPTATTSQAFVRRAFHASAVAGRYLYIDGGEISYFIEDSVEYQYANNTLAIDLSQDWVNSSVIFHSTIKPSEAPLLSESSLWYDDDDDVFYSGFTGRSSLFGDGPDPPPNSLWSFKPDGTGSGSWKVEISPHDGKWNRRTRTTGGYVASGGGSALVLGGILNRWTASETMDVEDDFRMPGLVEFNMTMKSFYNSSAANFNAQEIGGRGAMHYVPSFGPNGLFMIMGGTDFSDLNQNIGFDNIWVYETLENHWYKQTATGAIPRGRRNFCLAGVPYDEIFILTLPAFHWLKVDYPARNPRSSHSCNAVGGSQIVSIGGIDSNAKIPIGDLADIRKTPPSSPGQSSTPESSSPSSSNTGAIAGGAVGGFTALAMVACVAFFIYRRRRSQRSQPKARTNKRFAAELHGSEQQIQEADDAAVMMKTRMFQANQAWPLAELDEVRPEMGYDEAPWAPTKPYEMEAIEVRQHTMAMHDYRLDMAKTIT
ncbi:MAG: hypothetical protein Q9221_004245 [Calogaya cf. arnoldii]